MKKFFGVWHKTGILDVFPHTLSTYRLRRICDDSDKVNMTVGPVEAENLYDATIQLGDICMKASAGGKRRSAQINTSFNECGEIKLTKIKVDVFQPEKE